MTLMEAFAEEERLMPHLHLSLQAGDDLVLKRMKRRHRRADAIALCDSCAGCGPTWCSAPTSSRAFPPRPKRCSAARSKRFWAKLASVCPDFKERQQALSYICTTKSVDLNAHELLNLDC